MPISEIQALNEHLVRCNARDLNEQQAILEHIRQVRKQIEKGAYQDLAGCVDAANLLAEYLTRMGCIGPEGILRVVTQLMRTVQRSLERPLHSDPEQAESAPVEEQEEQEEQEEVEASVSEEDRRTLERLRTTLTPEEASSDLRLVSDRVLGELLVDLEVVQRAQVEQALSVQRATGKRIGEALVEIGAASWSDIQNALTVQASMRQRGHT